jgi:muramoyltetrapeptide carboxypeptidase
LGYRTKLFPHALAKGPLNYAGTAAERAADLHAAFADLEVDAVLCTRGGWGCAELLPLLDVGLVRANAKPFLGYSDVTTLHLWLRNQVGLVSFQAPMVAADFSKDGVEPADLASWAAALEGSDCWTLGAQAGMRVLRPGLAEGEVVGGCLSIVTESLGTPWAARWDAPVILALEDIGTKPYQWDRMLVHLRNAGLLKRAAGIVFGDMAQCVTADEQAFLEETLLHTLADFAGPIAIGLRSGHVAAGNITLPFGVQARLECGDAGGVRLSILEAATMF